MYLLAVPYAHISKTVRQARFKAACDLIKINQALICPVIYKHTLNEINGDYENPFLDLSFIRATDGLYVYQLPGWETDKDIQKMVDYYSLIKLPITYNHPMEQHMSGAFLDLWVQENLIGRNLNASTSRGFTKL